MRLPQNKKWNDALDVRVKTFFHTELRDASGKIVYPDASGVEFKLYKDEAHQVIAKGVCQPEIITLEENDGVRFPDDLWHYAMESMVMLLWSEYLKGPGATIEQI